MHRLTFDIIDRCNMSCPACLHGIYGGTKRVMELETAKKILDHCSHYFGACQLDIFNWGDPLLCNQLDEFLVLFDEYKHMPVVLSTSLNMSLSEQMLRHVLKSVSCVMFSISGITQKVYEQYHRAGNIRTVLKHLKFWAETKNKMSSNTRLICLFGRHRFNAHEEGPLRELCARHGVFFAPMRYFVTPLRDIRRALCGQTVEPSIYDLFYDSLEDLKKDIEQRLTPRFCYLLPDLVADVDGSILTCCGEKISLNTKITAVRSIEELIEARLANRFCRECAELGLSGYYLPTPDARGYHLDRGLK